MLEKMDKKYDEFSLTSLHRLVYPVSQVRSFCEKRQHLAAITQILLIDDPNLRAITLKFIETYFVSPSINLRETGIIDFLMMCIDEKTGNDALSLLYHIQSVTEEYNNDLDFTKFSNADRELIDTNDKIKNSLFLRYLPVPFVKFIVEEQKSEQVLAIFTSELTEQPALIWSKDMRCLLNQILTEHLAPFGKKLIEFSSNKVPNFRKIENMPIYSDAFKDVIKYPQIAKEIRCAEYYLRIWNKNNDKKGSVHQMVFFHNLESTFKEVTSNFPKLDLDDFQTVLKSFTLVYNR